MIRCALLSLCVLLGTQLLLSVNAQSLAVNTLANFESPFGSSYVYNPTPTVLNPWSFTSGQGGIAAAGSPWDPNAPAQPPSPNNYAFIQTNSVNTSTMSTLLTGLVPSANYSMSFYLATRGGSYASTQDQLIVTLGGVSEYISVSNLSDAGGWLLVNVPSFTYTGNTTSATLAFTATATNLADHAVLIDSVFVTAATYQAPTPLITSSNGGSLLSNFASPSLNGSSYGPGLTIQPYVYNPPVSSLQPFVWTGYGGIASLGSPWDDSFNSQPPPTSQYAFIQTSPNGLANATTSTMSTFLTGLTTNTQYYLSFYMGARSVQLNLPSYNTTSQLIITLGSAVIYTSPQNLSFTQGWQQISTPSFAAPSGTQPLVFTVNSVTNQEHALLLTSIFAVYAAGALAVNTLANFESPFGSSYVYNPTPTVLNPWSFTSGQGGIAAAGSPFDPNAPAQPPSPNNYAFIQTNSINTSTMSTLLTGLVPSANYTMSFYLATRGGSYASTQDQLIVTLGGVSEYISVSNLSDAGGWLLVNVPSFTYTGNTTSATLAFTATATNLADHAVLIDSVFVKAATYQAPTPLITTTAVGGLLSNFASPSLNGSSYGPGLTIQPYVYNPVVSTLQPFVWTGYGGIASLGSPWDDSATSPAPPSSQYAFIQTSPNGLANATTSTMSTFLTGLTTNSLYTLSFYLGARAIQQGTSSAYNTTSQLIITLGGAVIYTSPQNLSLPVWQQVVTSSFPAPSGTQPLVFTVNSLTNSDHAILITAIFAAPGSGSLAVNTLANFESPFGSSYVYNPTPTVLNPWSFTSGQGGIAAAGSPFDPNAPALPPSPNNYAFIQTNSINTSTMSTLLTGLVPSANYTMSFYLATRGGSYASTQDQLIVTLGGVSEYISVSNLSDAGGWLLVNVPSFTYTGNTTSATLAFTATATNLADHAVLIDSVFVTAATYQAPTPLITTTAVGGLLSNFASPSLNGSSYGPGLTIQPYVYNPVVSTLQPFVWTGYGGIASLGSPWDDSATSPAPPSSQYAFIQTSPNGLANATTSTMSTFLTGLTANTQYYLSFYLGARAIQLGTSSAYNTTSQLIVTLGGAVIYTSPQNLSLPVWQLFNSTSFATSTNGTQALVFTVNSLTNSDHAILLTNIMLSRAPLASSSSTGVGSSSSASFSSSVASSSNAVSSPTSATGIVSSSVATSTPSVSSSSTAISSVSSSSVLSSSSVAASASTSSPAASSSSSVITSSSRASSSAAASSSGTISSAAASSSGTSSSAAASSSGISSSIAVSSSSVAPSSSSHPSSSTSSPLISSSSSTHSSSSSLAASSSASSSTASASSGSSSTASSSSSGILGSSSSSSSPGFLISSASALQLSSALWMMVIGTVVFVIML